MLNKIKAYCLLFAIALVNSNCNSDEGNYNYSEVNEIKSSGIEEIYTVYTGDNFKLEPNLEYTIDEGSNPERYTYEWIALNPLLQTVSTNKPPVIATTRNFDGEIKLPPAKYTIYYKVKDLETGVTWQQPPFTLNVVSAIYEGWLVLGEVDGKARLDMISIIPGVTEPRIINDVLDASGSSLKLKGKAVDVECFSTPFVSPLMYGIYVTASESGTSRLEENSFAWDQTQNIAYETVGGAFDTNFGVDFMISPRAGENLIYSKGNIYSYYRTYQTRYGLPQNLVEYETRAFYAAPFIADNGGSAAAPIFYDTEKRRFLRYSFYTSSCTTMPTFEGSGSAIDYNDTKSDLVYMTTSAYNGNENFAVLKNINTGKYNLLRFNRTFVQTYYKEILNAPDFDKATKFAVSPDSGYLFYVVGNKVYQYDHGTQSAKLMIDKGAEEITYMAFNTKVKAHANKLSLGTYGATGKLELYTVPPVNGDLILEKSYSGLCKIVDVAYRVR